MWMAVHTAVCAAAGLAAGRFSFMRGPPKCGVGVARSAPRSVEYTEVRDFPPPACDVVTLIPMPPHRLVQCLEAQFHKIQEMGYENYLTTVVGPAQSS